jgi:molybdenum cofactor synthesis domain-containing protein
MIGAIVTVSSSRATASAQDESGPRLAAFAESIGVDVKCREIVADERSEIEALLRKLADEHRLALILTTGGTGFAPDDVTPEATRAVIDREAPGLAEAVRIAGRPHTPHWMLSRAVAGIRGSTLIVNFPGSPASIDQAGAAIADALPHGLSLLSGEKSPDHHSSR